MKLKGFTLLECLVALVLIGLFLLTAPSLLKQGKQIEQQVFGHQEQEWQVFLIQMENKLAEGTFTKIERKAIHFVKERNGKETTGAIEFRATAQMIVIRDNGGYEPVLLNVTNFQLQQQQQTIVFEVSFKNGTIRSGKWTTP